MLEARFAPVQWGVAMGTSGTKLFISSVAAIFALTCVAPPAHSRDGFIAGAIVGGIAGAAIGSMLSRGVHPRYYYGGPPRRTAKAAAVEDMTAVQ